MSHLNRRRFVSTLTVAGLCAVAGPAAPAAAKKKKKKKKKGGGKRVGFRLSEKHELRLKVDSTKTHDNGRLYVMLLGKIDGDPHFKDDFITWGPFGNQNGVTRPIYLPAGNYEIRIDGGFIRYSVAIQGRSVKQKHETGADYRTIVSKSGAITGKG